MGKFIVGVMVGVTVGVVLTVLGAALYISDQEHAACRATGGTVVPGERGCFKLERIK